MNRVKQIETNLLQSSNGNSVHTLDAIIRSLQLEMQEFRHKCSRDAIREIVEEVYDEDIHRLEKLRDDTVKALNFLVDIGVITRQELNEAIK